MPEQAVPLSRRVPALDGLRALAILAVLMTHLMPGHDSNRGLRAVVFKLADVGWLGVDLFFVLSGFLITKIVLRCRRGHGSLGEFFARRILRIFPLYAAALVAILFVYPLVSGKPVPGVEDQLPYWTLLNNYFPGRWESVNGVPVSHFWSLAVEVQFYALWPFVVYHCRTRTVLVVMALLLAMGIAGRAIAALAGADYSVAYGWTPLHLDSLMAGSLVALGVIPADKRVQSVSTALLIAGSVAVFCLAWSDLGSSMFKPDGLPIHVFLIALLPSLAAATFGAAIFLALQDTRLAAVLSHRVFAPLALYSYGAYIIHFPLSPWFERMFGPRVLDRWLSPDLAIYCYFVLAAAASFCLAALSYHAFEVHFLKRTRG